MTDAMNRAVQALPQSEASYKLPRDDRESIRLNAQHYAFTQRLGWLLHPKVREHVSKIKNPRVADVACGTGLWVFELARELPNASVAGTDVSSGHFPPEWTWPTNATLGILDLTKEVPLEYQGSFDVVHCRLVLATGPTVDWETYANTFRKLLKPGGYLQWEEVPYPQMRTVEPVLENGRATGRYNHTTIRYDTIANVVHLPEKGAWFSDFENHMSQVEGFGDVEQYDAPVCPWTQKVEHDVTVTGAKTATDHCIKAMKIDNQEFLDRVSAEMSIVEKYRSEGTMMGFYFIAGIAKAV